MWPPTKVLFMNDVYFCARDAVRLLLHKADIACGMDFFHKPGEVRTAAMCAQTHLTQTCTCLVGLCPELLGQACKGVTTERPGASSDE